MNLMYVTESTNTPRLTTSTLVSLSTSEVTPGELRNPTPGTTTAEPTTVVTPAPTTVITERPTVINTTPVTPTITVTEGPGGQPTTTTAPPPTTTVPQTPPTTVQTTAPPLPTIPTTTPGIPTTAQPTPVPTTPPRVPTTAQPTTVLTTTPGVPTTAQTIPPVPTTTPGIPTTAQPTPVPTTPPRVPTTAQPTTVLTTTPGVPTTAQTIPPVPTTTPGIPTTAQPTPVPTTPPRVPTTAQPTTVLTTTPGVPTTAQTIPPVPTTTPGIPTTAQPTTLQVPTTQPVDTTTKKTTLTYIVYFTIVVVKTIIISIGQNIVFVMQVRQVTTYSFVMQVASSGQKSTTYTLSSRAKSRWSRQANEQGGSGPTEIRLNGEDGNSTSTYTSAMADNPNATSTNAEDVDCMYTMTVTVVHVEFTYSNGTRYPCNVDDQANASPPYLEISDVFNRTTRYCFVETDQTIISFGDELQGQLVLGDSIDLNDIIPIIELNQTRNEPCCGGVFYTRYGDNLQAKEHYATSQNYPEDYANNMRCPYIFKCIPVPPATKCTVQVDFIDFKIDAPNQKAALQLQLLQLRHKRQTSSNSTEIDTSVVPVNQGFNKCKDGDFVRVATCGSISGYESQLFCADRSPIKSFTSDSEVLAYFQSDEETTDKGFVLSYVSLDPVYGSFSELELEPYCRCGTVVPARIRAAGTVSDKLNKGKKNNSAKKKQNAKRAIFKRKRDSLREKREADKEGQEKRQRGDRQKGPRGTTPNGVRRRYNGNPENKPERENRYKGNPENKPERENQQPNGRVIKRRPGVRKDSDADKEVAKKRFKGTTKRPFQGRKKRPFKKVTKANRKIAADKLKQGKVTGPAGARIYKGKTVKNETESTNIVVIVQRNLSLVKNKGGGKKKKEETASRHRVKRQGKNNSRQNKFQIARQCTGTVINERFVLTSTSCCTYCPPVWYKKYRNKQQTTLSEALGLRKKRAAPGDNDGEGQRKDKAKRRQKEQGNSTAARESKKGTKKRGNGLRKDKDKDANKQSNKGGKEGRKQKFSKGKVIASERQGDTTLSDKEKKKKQRQREKKKAKKQRQREKEKNRKKFKFRDPKKADIFILVGLYKIKPKKNDVSKYKKNIVKPKSIYIPDDCYNNWRNTKSKEYYPVDCPVLIQTGKPMDVQNAIKPMCLPAFDTFDITKSLGSSMGYGKRSLTSKRFAFKPKVLTNINYMSAIECQKKVKKTLDEDMFCTRAKRGAMCEGDWGSPLILYKSTSEGHSEHISAFAVLAQTGCAKKKSGGKKKEKTKVIRKKVTPGEKVTPGVTPKKRGPIRRKYLPTSNSDKNGNRGRREVNDRTKNQNNGNGQKGKGDDNKDGQKAGQNGRQDGGRERDNKDGQKDKKNEGNGNNEVKRPKKVINKEQKEPNDKRGNNNGKGKGPSEPGVTQRKRKPGVTQRKRKPGVTQLESKPGVTQRKRKPGVTQRKRKPGVTQLKSKPGGVIKNPIRGKEGTNKPGRRKYNKGKRPNSPVMGSEWTWEIEPRTGTATYIRQTDNSKKNNAKQRKQPKKYNKTFSNKKGIDVWVRIDTYMNWILRIVFDGNDDYLCQRPLDFASTPAQTNTSLLERCYDPPDREGGVA
ncbi:hypothetical protein SK128_022602 [Halocaridina rubra]|uniref:CUB domain-containing protein n=1 Tax=Halocaridina rubra TaxID=373956 RepID=A0AAN9ACP0_HALRR